jgi:Escherichia/Staphylococcus phage prohead protease
METRSLPMSLRSVNDKAHTVEGIVVPYNETSLYAGDPIGERILRHAFTRSIAQRGNRIPLCINHDHSNVVGMSREWDDGDAGLVGLFDIRADEYGARAVADLAAGYLQSMSVGFLPIDAKRASDGVLEIREARLVETSLVLMGAYDGAQVLAARHAAQVSELLAPFQNPPALPVPFVAPWV